MIEIFPDNANVNWPPRSRDLRPLDYFVWDAKHPLFTLTILFIRNFIKTVFLRNSKDFAVGVLVEMMYRRFPKDKV